MPNFTGMDGLREPRRTQRLPTTGARMMMNSGLMFCSSEAGISKEPKVRSVKSRANRFIDEPACSKPDQNIAAPRNSSAITNTLLRSLPSRQTNRITARKYSSASEATIVPVARAKPASVIVRMPKLFTAHSSTIRPITAATPPKNWRLARACTPEATDSGGSSPQPTRFFCPARYWMMPKVMPTPAAPKPQCQLIPSPKKEQIVGPITAPMLMPM